MYVALTSFDANKANGPFSAACYKASGSPVISDILKTGPHWQT